MTLGNRRRIERRASPYAIATALLLAIPAFIDAPTSTMVLSLRGLERGTEEARVQTIGARTQLATRTQLSLGGGIALEASFETDGDSPHGLRVAGTAPPFLMATEHDRAAVSPAGAFPIQSAFPIHVVAALVRHARASGRRQVATLTNRTATVESCPAVSSSPPADGACYLVSGLTWGAMQLWLDARQELSAAVIPTPWGLVTATRREALPARDALLAYFARTTAARLRERVGAPAPETDIVFAGVRIVDPVERSAAVGSVHVRDGTIVAVDRTGARPVPAGARVVRGEGLSLLPGLWDMHAHVKQADWGPAYLAVGVTTARDVGNDARFITALREEERAGRFPAPNLWLAAFIDADAPAPHTAVQANTADEARRLVRRFASDGFDQIKLWNHVSRDVLRPLVEEAHRRGMTVTRHAPSGVEAIASIDAGVDQINHIDALLEAAGGDLDSPPGRALLARLTARRIVVDPTLVVTEFGSRSLRAPLSTIEPDAGKAPAPVQLAWSSFGQPPDRASGEPLARAFRFVRQLHRAGVPIVAGSDQGIPGYTLLREIEHYVAAGLSPIEAIAAATWVPARVMGVSDRVGRIEAGYRADLTIVEGNPAVSIRDLRRVRYVVRGGRLFAPDRLWRAVEFQP